MDETSEFDARWTAFVLTYADSDESTRAELVHLVLDEGLDRVLTTGAVRASDDAATAMLDPADRWTCEYDLILASGRFEEFGYIRHYPEYAWALCAHREGLRHFVRYGWRMLLNPSPEFDLWWYWSTYLDPEAELVNPLVHFLAEGRHRGHGTVPVAQPMHAPPPAAPPGGRRRVCLFAGFDGDGIIDDTVVTYVRELSRFADVYYLADCVLEAGELEKLEPYTRGRWAIRHGLYDFGSYSKLARDLVGWDTIATYDELLLVNDSSYLLRPLDEVFDRMESRPVHWWGLQATDYDFTPGVLKKLGRRLSVEEMAVSAREHGAWRMTDVFHIGSYFVAVRSEVIADPEFRRRLDTVSAQTDKDSIVKKYEIGISHYLTMAGFRVDTFVDGVLPFHPIYRASAFDLLGEGFPLIKRQFLHENPFDVPDLAAWKERLLAVTPGADVDAIEANLWRVSPPYNVRRALGVRTLADGSVAIPEPVLAHNFDDYERWAPRFDHWWAFVVDPVTHRLGGNARAVFEAVRFDPAIRKVLIVEPGSPRLGGANVTVVPAATQASTWYLFRSRTIFVTRGPRADVAHPLSGTSHRFVGLRPNPLLSFGVTTKVGPDGDRKAHNDAVHDVDLTRAVVASSPAQRKAMRKAALRSPSPPNIWVTGSPRTDLLVSPEESLAADLRAQLRVLRRATGGRRLVVWAPVRRRDGRSPRALAAHELEWLRAWGERHDAVVGVRPTSRARTDTDWPGVDPAMIRAAGMLVLTHRLFPDVEMVLREAAALVTDYASELLDFSVLSRPVLAYVPDLDEVAADPGLLHDLADVVAGPVCRNRSELFEAWENLLTEPTAEQVAERARVRDLLHSYRDGRCGLRVVRRVQATYLPKAWFPPKP